MNLRGNLEAILGQVRMIFRATWRGLRGNLEAILGQDPTKIRGNLEWKRDHAEKRATETSQVPTIVGMAAGTRIADRPGDLLGWAIAE